MSTGALSEQEVRERVEWVEALLAELERLDDERARDAALEAVQGLVELYGETLARLMGGVASACGSEVVSRLARDELIGHVLMIHDLHPEALEVRVRRALEEVRPFLRSHGGNVELLGVEAGVARLRLVGSCHGCPSSSATLRHSIEEAVRRAAPELEQIVAEDAPAAASASPPALVQLGGPGRREHGAL